MFRLSQRTSGSCRNFPRQPFPLSRLPVEMAGMCENSPSKEAVAIKPSFLSRHRAVRLRDIPLRAPVVKKLLSVPLHECPPWLRGTPGGSFRGTYYHPLASLPRRGARTELLHSFPLQRGNPHCRAPSCLATLLLLSVLAACSHDSGPAQEVPPKSPPRNANVILITIDTLRADYLSCYGQKKISTPQIDRLAARGVRFSQAIAQIPLTTPSHACILTGTYPQVHKVRDIGAFVLDKNVPTLASIAGEAGFETGA